MSYILDALRKADAERERDAVPGIHTQPTIGGAAAHGKAASGLAPWVGATLAAAALVLLAAALWFAWGGGATREAVTLAPRQVAQAPETAPAPATTAAPMPAPGSVVTAAPAVVAAASGVAKAPADAARIESAVRTPAAGATTATSAPPGPRTPRPVAAKPAPPSAEAAAAKGPTNTEVKPAAPAASAVKVYALHELPAEIRRQLPEVTVGGSMYSPVAADRIVIINGQVLHEGDRIGPELVLQQIKAKSAVFGFKGYRYDMAY